MICFIYQSISLEKKQMKRIYIISEENRSYWLAPTNVTQTFKSLGAHLTSLEQWIHHRYFNKCFRVKYKDIFEDPAYIGYKIIWTHLLGKRLDFTSLESFSKLCYLWPPNSVREAMPWNWFRQFPGFYLSQQNRTAHQPKARASAKVYTKDKGKIFPIKSSSRGDVIIW